MRKAPLFIFRCGQCGQQWLRQRVCCERECTRAPQHLSSVADSIRAPGTIDFSVLLPLNHNATSVRQTVTAWRKRLAGESFEFIFVVVSPSDEILEFVRAQAHECNVRSLRMPAQTSLSRNYNLGAQAARGRFLLLAQSAIARLPSGFLGPFAAALADARVGLVGSVSTLQKHDSAPPSCDPRYCFSNAALSGPVVCLRPETFWEVGGLDERFHSYTLATKDLQYRLICANYRLAQVPASDSSARKVLSVSHRREKFLRADQDRFARKYRRQLSTLKNPQELFTRHPYPKLSVAIATRNYGLWLRRCLNSILRKTDSETPLQIVVTDDCSTDDTQLILERYRNKYPRVLSLVRPRSSSGVPLAKNLAVRRSIASYIAMHDADDEFYPHKVRRCMNALRESPEADFLTHDYRFIDSATGETFVPGDDWFGDWRPPGVWVFRAGRVDLNEQMVCGYEELEWASRFWRSLHRIHVPTPLTIVHGQYVTDRWKVDREFAGVQSMKRWRSNANTGRGPNVFACFRCGNQYFNQIVCCGEPTAEVPLVCYMALASAPTHAPVEFSIVVFMSNGLTTTRKVVRAWRQDPEAKHAEWIFVQCHPRRPVLDYLRDLARETKVKVVFSPSEHPHVYSHDANRAVRCADGSLLLFLEGAAQTRGSASLSAMRAALSDRQVGIAGIAPAKEKLTVSQRPDAGRPLSRVCYGLRKDVFWELGAMDERFEGDGLEVIDLQYLALKHNYHLAQVAQLKSKGFRATRADISCFAQKHGLRRHKTRTQSDFFAGHRLPGISVAIATRNEVRFLPRCLDSVLRAAQRVRVTVQVVVVNDCSSDETRLVLETYRQRFPRTFTILHNETTLGPARARNVALARCIGAYVACLAPRDQFRPAKLNDCLHLLRKSGADFLSHNVMGNGDQLQMVTWFGRRAAPYSTWMFRNGVVHFNEQMMAKGCDHEWLKRYATRLKTVHSPLKLAQRQRHAKLSPWNSQAGKGASEVSPRSRY